MLITFVWWNDIVELKFIIYEPAIKVILIFDFDCFWYQSCRSMSWWWNLHLIHYASCHHQLEFHTDRPGLYRCQSLWFILSWSYPCPPPPAISCLARFHCSGLLKSKWITSWMKNWRLFELNGRARTRRYNFMRVSSRSWLASWSCSVKIWVYISKFGDGLIKVPSSQDSKFTSLWAFLAFSSWRGWATTVKSSFRWSAKRLCSMRS